VIPKLDDRENRPATTDEKLRSGLPYRALSLRLAAYPSLGQGEHVNVVAALEAAEPGARLTAAVFGLFDARGRLAGKWTATAQQLSSAPLLSAGEVMPGAYRLRAVAVDTSGRRGVVESAVTASLHDAKPLRLSGIVLGTAYDSRFVPKLLFGTDQSAVALVEAYGSGPRPNSISARLDVLSFADARVLSGAPATVSSATAERHTITGTLPIAGLAAGDYLVRVVVSVDGRPVGEVARTLRKTFSVR
jgi:hypothetical protein